MSYKLTVDLPGLILPDLSFPPDALINLRLAMSEIASSFDESRSALNHLAADFATVREQFSEISPHIRQAFWSIRIANSHRSDIIGGMDQDRAVAERFARLTNWHPNRRLMEARVPDLPDIRLTPEEEEDSRRHKIQSHLIIQVTGSLENRRSNGIKIAGNPVILPDAEFILFLRLVVALYEVEDGFISRGNRHGGGLVEEKIYSADSLDQVVHHLRSRLGPALQGLSALKFIEVQRGKIRLSTHWRYVLVNRSELFESSGHPHSRPSGSVAGESNALRPKFH